jgi:NADH-quinone oxidoreductase subunit A
VYFDLANIFVFAVVGAGFVLVNLLISRLLRPKSGTEPSKLAIYECGEPTIGQAWIRFDIRFYTVALMFVVFDVEVALLFPWAAVFRDLAAEGQGWLAFVEALAFIVILMVGLAYVWVRGDIEWTPAPRPPREGGDTVPFGSPSARMPARVAAVPGGALPTDPVEGEPND